MGSGVAGGWGSSAVWGQQCSVYTAGGERMGSQDLQIVRDGAVHEYIFKNEVSLFCDKDSTKE